MYGLLNFFFVLVQTVDPTRSGTCLVTPTTPEPGHLCLPSGGTPLHCPVWAGTPVGTVYKDTRRHRGMRGMLVGINYR